MLASLRDASVGGEASGSRRGRQALWLGEGPWLFRMEGPHSTTKPNEVSVKIPGGMSGPRPLAQEALSSPNLVAFADEAASVGAVSGEHLLSERPRSATTNAQGWVEPTDRVVSRSLG